MQARAALLACRKKWQEASGSAGSSLKTLAGTWLDENGAGGTRTHDLRFRKPSLYPAELQPQVKLSMNERANVRSSRGEPTPTGRDRSGNVCKSGSREALTPMQPPL